VYEYLDGFKADVSGCRKPEDLPVNAMRYIRFIEAAVGCPIKYVSVGAGRDEYLVMEGW
jgi:adenylosuccinate synthase